jgi:hypothetical protein
MRIPSPLLLAAATLAAAPALAATPEGAHEVSVPLRLDFAFVRELLVEQFYTEPGEKADVWSDGVGCAWLELYEPAVDMADGRLRVVSRSRARVGQAFGDVCLGNLDWEGFVELFMEPELAPERPVVTFTVVDSRVYDDRQLLRTASRVLWDLVKLYVHRHLGRLEVDLGGPVGELRAWLPLVLGGPSERVERLLASLALREPRVAADGLLVTLAFAVEPTSAPPPQAEPALTPEEVARWEARWQRWDAFLTFVVKRSARESGDELRPELADVLLGARHDLLGALAPPGPGAPDPVPGLFLRAWEELAPLLRREAAALPHGRALQYLGFIAAGDALAALGQIGPEIGLDISADGLRRLARMIDAEGAEDPVAYRLEIDPELRGLLGLGPPLPPPWLPEPGPESEPGPVAALLDLLDWLVPTARAAIDRGALTRLNQWAPSRGDLDEYLPLVREVLLDAQARVLDTAGLGDELHVLYRRLVLATAWQESCWRQFVERGGKVVTLRSPSGSAGIMQVNPHVWRGAYDVEGLLGDVEYNARAGSEILRHYLVDYAIRKGEHQREGGLDNLPRATYLLYNGGPRQLARYRAKPHPRVTRVITAFLEKYEAVRDGRELEVARCYGVQGAARSAPDPGA